MKRALLLAIAFTGCAHGMDPLREFPHFDYGWWLGPDQCPKGSHRAELERDNDEVLLGCQLPDGRRHGPFAWLTRRDGPVFVGSYAYDAVQPMYFDSQDHWHSARSVGRDGRMTLYFEGLPDFVAEHSLGCVDGELEQYDENGELVFRTRYNDGAEIGPRVPVDHGSSLPPFCIIGAEAYCPPGVTQWTQSANRQDDCRTFKEERYARELRFKRPEAPLCVGPRPSENTLAAAFDVSAIEFQLSSFVASVGRLPTETQLWRIVRSAQTNRHDPWGRPYIYDATSHTRVRSAGPDGQHGNADDVTIFTEAYGPWCSATDDAK